MNAAHLHVMLNHFPIFGIMFGFAFLVIGMVFKKPIHIKSAMWIVIIVALATIPVFLTGEGAEEVIEGYPDISREVIHEHEEWGEKALIVTLLIGIIALIGFLLQIFTKTLSPGVPWVLLILILGDFVILYETAEHGGKIIHREFEAGQKTPSDYDFYEDIDTLDAGD